MEIVEGESKSVGGREGVAHEGASRAVREALAELEERRRAREGQAVATPQLDPGVILQCAAPDPGVALRAVHELAAALDDLERAAVERARRAGWGWAEVARLLGRSRQAVHQRHAARPTPPDARSH